MDTVRLTMVELVIWNSLASAAAPGANIVAARLLYVYYSQYGVCFLAKGAQELPYAVSKKALARTTWTMRFHDGQFRGFWGSSGPSQSTTLSFASCSIA